MEKGVLVMSLHIEARDGEIADRILLPGDPLRAKYIAETFLEGARCFNRVRGSLTPTIEKKCHEASKMAYFFVKFYKFVSAILYYM